MEKLLLKFVILVNCDEDIVQLLIPLNLDIKEEYEKYEKWYWEIYAKSPRSLKYPHLPTAQYLDFVDDWLVKLGVERVETKKEIPIIKL